jgi:hypothetical protein
MKLPRLIDGAHWRVSTSDGSYVAAIFTLDVDCTVSLERGSISISTGVAPWQMVHAVLVANGVVPAPPDMEMIEWQ